MTISMAVGQAGGTAAALASDVPERAFRAVPIDKLQRTLQSDGAHLELAASPSAA
jgi:hypothetical protein